MILNMSGYDLALEMSVLISVDVKVDTRHVEPTEF
jgi:hypothetical protein